MTPVAPQRRRRARRAAQQLVCALAASLVACAAGAATAFVNANVIPMSSETVLTGQTLIVRDGRIAEVGPYPDLTGVDVIIDVRGRFLLPGLAEMHAHVPPPAEQTYLQDVLALWLANGITTVRGVLGHESHLALREALEQQRLPGPRFYASGPSLRGGGVAGPDHAREIVRAQHAAGYDLVKLHPGLTRQEFDAIADEAHRLGIDVVGHVSLDVGLLHSLARGQRTIEHLDGYVHALVPDLHQHPEAAQSFFGVDLVPHVDRGRIDDLVAATRAAGSWVVPTQTLFENVAARPQALNARTETQFIPAELLARYDQAVAAIGSNPNLPALIELREVLIKALHDAGVPLLLGADSPQIFNVPGFATHRELEAMVAAGLTPYEALRTATVNVARYFDNNAGVLEIGHDADIVLLRGNPLVDIRHSAVVDGVMLRGRWYDADELQQMLADIAARYRAGRAR
jgi:imidazolonepropionase-like amidohydrolase